MMLNANLNYAHKSNPSLDITTHGWGGYGYLRVRQQLPWDLALTGYVSGYLSTPDLYDVNKTSLSDQISYGLDLQKSFLKEKRLNVSLNIRNPFGHGVRLYVTEPRNAGYTGYSRTYHYNNANDFSVSVSYRFGSLNASVKKTAKSISNDDVENRKN